MQKKPTSQKFFSPIFIYDNGVLVYSYEVFHGVSSTKHTIFNHSLYDEMMDISMEEKGEGAFIVNCSPCHRINGMLVGPGLKCATSKYKDVEIINMAMGDNGHHPVRINEKEADAIIAYLKSTCD